MHAALDRPAPARFAAATRTDEDITLAAMRRGETPTGDYIADLMAGCDSVRCKAMLRYADETAPRSLFLRMREDASGFDVTANFSGDVSCWAVNDDADAQALPPLRVTAGETRDAQLLSPIAGFISCVGATTALPSERRAAFAGARTPEAFDALAHDDVIATVRKP